MISFLKKLQRPVFEIGAGTCYNLLKHRDTQITYAGFDLLPHSCSKCENVYVDKSTPIKHGMNGSIEDKYSDFVLLISEGVDAQKSVSKYTGNVVIFGGHAMLSSVSNKDVELIRDVSNPMDITTFNTSEITEDFTN